MIKDAVYIIVRIAWLSCLLYAFPAKGLATVEIPSLFIQNFSNQDYKASCQNWGMAAGSNGFLYVANNSGLLIFDGNSWTTYETPGQSIPESIAIYQDTVFTGHYNDFGYWLSDPNGIYTYHSLKKNFASVRFRNETFHTLLSTKDALWLKSEHHLFQYKNGILKTFPFSGEASLFQDDNRLFLFVRHVGLHEWVDTGFRLLPQFDSLKERNIVFMHWDQKGYVTGTKEDGVFYVTDQACIPWASPINNELKHSRITSLEVIDNMYLIGTAYNGLYITCRKGTLYEHYTLGHQLQNNNIHRSYKQDDRTVWLAFDNGISLLSFFSPVTLLEERSKIGKLQNGMIDNGSIVVETNQGIFRQVALSEDRFSMEPFTGPSPFVKETKIHDILASLPPAIADTLLPLQDVMMENDYIVWGIQDDTKIYRFRLSNIAEEIESIKNYTLGEVNTSVKIKDIVSIDGFTVVFTGQGCWRYDRLSDQFIPFPQLEKQLDAYAMGTVVFPAAKDYYWIILNNEAAFFHIKDNHAQLECRILFDNYNLNIVNRDKNIIPLSDSLHLISTMQGVLLVNTEGFKYNRTDNRETLSVRQIQYTENSAVRTVPFTSQKITLPHDFQNLKLKIATSATSPVHQISYKMDGISTEWSDWQKEGNISFFHLPAGNYRLTIRKYVVKGDFPEISLLLKVKAPWYNTLWAYIFYLLLVWIWIRGGLHYYLKYQRKQEKALLDTEHAAEQQRLQKLRNEMLETELQNKNKELTLQTSALVKRNQVMQALLDELESQKQLLGDRYPNKLYNRMKTLMKENLNNQSDWIQFENYFNSAHQKFIDRLKIRFPDLTPGDFRICCLLRMNLSTKEIASLLNISVRSVELRRYRLRKRLALEGDANLVDFLSAF